MELGECRRGATAVLWIIAAVQKLEGAQGHGTNGKARDQCIVRLAEWQFSQPFLLQYAAFIHRKGVNSCLPGQDVVPQAREELWAGSLGAEAWRRWNAAWCLGSMPADAAWHLTQSLSWQGPFQSRAHRTATPLLLTTPPPAMPYPEQVALFFKARQLACPLLTSRDWLPSKTFGHAHKAPFYHHRTARLEALSGSKRSRLAI